MKYYGATVACGIYVEAENENEAGKLILEEARKLGMPDPFIIDLDEEDENGDPINNS